jgi:hypothetical protein
LERTGLLADILDSETAIDRGRKWLDTDGYEANGRALYHKGLETAMDAFQEAQSHAPDDLETLMLAEYTFLTQELQFCDQADTEAITSLRKAIEGFDDAFLALEAVGESMVYRGAEMTHPHRGNYRYKGMPNDAFHIACNSHHARLGNILKSPGVNPREKGLIHQRRLNLLTARATYLEKQKTSVSTASEKTAP